MFCFGFLVEWFVCYNFTMKIIIVSDTHGNTDNINYIVNNYKYDYLLFLGDGIVDLGNLIYAENVKYVKGNCDLFADAPADVVLEIMGKKFFITHGHNYNVKMGLGGLLKQAKLLGADYVFYGHTHNYFHKVIDNINVLNPGAFSKTRGGKQTFVVMELQNKKSDFKVIQF